MNARAAPDAVEAYLDLLREVLIGAVTGDRAHQIVPWAHDGTAPLPSIAYDPEARDKGLDWPLTALSMIGRKRMDNLRVLTREAVESGIPGDLVETGVWRGGACIYMRGILHILGDRDRKIWVCDSFEGLPLPDPKYPADDGLDLKQYGQLAISQEEVEANFARFGWLDDQVRFLKGWFKDTLHSAPIDRIAVLRLDGDLYESTMDALSGLYERVSPGGFVIIDDYHAFEACRDAVHDYLGRIGGALPEIHEIDGTGTWFRKGA